jgi:uncharacterized sulfatase
MSSTEKRPNILFFFTDQQRWDTCGCYGQELPITPNLDRMAAEGVRFDKAFTCQPVCGPARGCIQTGKYATEIGVHTNNRLLPLDEPTLPKWLSPAGYEVGYIGKWHLASFGPADGEDSFRTKPVPPERRGGYKDYWLASDTLEFTSHSYDGYMFDTGRMCWATGRWNIWIRAPLSSHFSCSSHSLSRIIRTITGAMKARTDQRNAGRNMKYRVI